MAYRHCWVELPLIDGLVSHVRADQVAAVAPVEAFPELCGPGAAGGSAVAVGNMLLRSTLTPAEVRAAILLATA